jgi:hypothetical protein
MVEQSLIRVGNWPTAQGERTKTATTATATVAVGNAEALSPARPAAFPIRSFLAFILALVLMSALTCIYIWQLSQVSAIRLETRALEATVRELEQENVALMLVVAEQNSPALVDLRARSLGMVPVEDAVHVAISPDGPAPAAEVHTAADSSRTLAALWQSLIGPFAN